VRLAPVRLAPVRLTPVRLAPVRLAPVTGTNHPGLKQSGLWSPRACACIIEDQQAQSKRIALDDPRRWVGSDGADSVFGSHAPSLPGRRSAGAFANGSRACRDLILFGGCAARLRASPRAARGLAPTSRFFLRVAAAPQRAQRALSPASAGFRRRSRPFATQWRYCAFSPQRWPLPSRSGLPMDPLQPAADLEKSRAGAEIASPLLPFPSQRRAC
jgi:hypothetical protein